MKKKSAKIPCVHWNECGGCPLIRFDYNFQLEHKQEKVFKAFTDAGFDKAFIKEILKPTRASPLTLGYRNKAKWILQRDSNNGRLKMGIYYPGTHEVIDIPRCAVHAAPINEVSFYIKQKLEDLKVPCGSSDLAQPSLRYLIVRYSFRDKKLIAVFVTSAHTVPGLDKVIKALDQKFGDRIVAIVQNINADDNNVLLGEANRFHKKRGDLTETMGNVRIPVGPLSFLQVNSIQASYLYQRAKKLLGGGPYALGLDLYSGVGLFALHMASSTKKILSCEDMGPAALEAITAARRNRAHNILQLCADASEGISTFYSEFGTPDWVILNPPRKGCDESVMQLLAQRPSRKLLYISCNPSSLARDLSFLLNQAPGLKLKALEPVDMFPQTDHVECLALVENSSFKPDTKSATRTRNRNRQRPESLH